MCLHIYLAKALAILSAGRLGLAFAGDLDAHLAPQVSVIGLLCSQRK